MFVPLRGGGDWQAEDGRDAAQLLHAANGLRRLFLVAARPRFTNHDVVDGWLAFGHGFGLLVGVHPKRHQGLQQLSQP